MLADYTLNIEKIMLNNPADTDKKRIKPFGIRWNEKLGHEECPYMRRWVFNFYFFSIRVHQWYRSDDKRYMHNHAFNFLTIILKGSYWDVSSIGEYGGIHAEFLPTGSIRYREASHIHFVGDPKHGTITLLFCGMKKQNWGFLVKGKIMRPLRFFSRYGHPTCEER